ncbi:tetratricopeptide repeat protein [Parendozoicomonas haliclonae]|uniref:Tetratricopeptide repeat protein n=1 Tax=Parendozoicomonas haliclonae TaxID=1960125 RepID=A0A1X7AFU0_9GAMM|nr:hypothetical protein [Parendozoicomonas haliclonae]SMA36257.1 hypothetical protein EHSB41UT_00614 [Parendozoicomonas haliclonae]
MSDSLPESREPQLTPDASDNQITESHKDWMLTQAYTRLQQRQYTDALVLLHGLKVLLPEDPEVYRMLSYALLMADKPEECLVMADRYLQCLPPHTDHQEINWIQGRAKVRMEKAQTSGPEDNS